MKRAIKVYLNDGKNLIGSILYDAQGARESAVFQYDASWLNSSLRFAIEPNLPLVSGPQFHKKIRDGSIFHGSISDTEPDGWGRKVILRDHAKRNKDSRKSENKLGKTPLNGLDFLLAVDDFSRVGALRFQDEEGIFRRAIEKGRRTAPPLIELSHLLSATRAVEDNNESLADLEYLRGRGTSLGGMRPKCTVLDDDGSLSIAKGEVLAMHLAREAGMNVAKARLIFSEDTPVALIRRFDRSEDGGRLLYISAATMLGVDAVDPGQHTYTEIVDALRVCGATVQQDINELWKRIAFSIMITNVDDHLLNHGFLHVERGKWRLAPAFDLNPFPDRVRELKTWISEETGPKATVEALMSVTPYFKMTMKQAKEILVDIERAVSSWRKKGRALGMTTYELDQFGDAFEHVERRK
jgi:serine/threonine-protein kinase HipA